jgi:prevent-host-death family protein
MLLKPNNIVPITELKRDAAALVARATDERSPIVITQNGRATAVLVDINSFECERETMAMLEIVAQGERDAREGRVMSHTEHRKRIHALFKQHGSRR